MRRIELVCGLFFLLAFCLLLQLQLESRGLADIEGFETLDISCTKCMKYFGDAANVGSPESISTFAQAAASLLSGALDALVAFMSDKTKFCDEPPSDIAGYMTCLMKYINKNVDKCKADGVGVMCTMIPTLIEDIMNKAIICAADCDDVKVYPLEEERIKCKNTGKCKSIEELETNIKTIVETIKPQIMECKVALESPDTDCFKYFAKLIKTKQASAKALAQVQTAQENVPGLGSGYGRNDKDFETASLVIANVT